MRNHVRRIGRLSGMGMAAGRARAVRIVPDRRGQAVADYRRCDLAVSPGPTARRGAERSRPSHADSRTCGAGRAALTDRCPAVESAPSFRRSPGVPAMTHVVTESCIKCRFTDCVDVCPVDCFREGPNFLSIDPDECIDCAVCIPECPVNAIYAEEDVPAGPEGLHRDERRAVEGLAEHHADEAALPGRRRSGSDVKDKLPVPGEVSRADAGLRGAGLTRAGPHARRRSFVLTARSSGATTGRRTSSRSAPPVPRACDFSARPVRPAWACAGADGAGRLARVLDRARHPSADGPRVLFDRRARRPVHATAVAAVGVGDAIRIDPTAYGFLRIRPLRCREATCGCSPPAPASRPSSSMLADAEASGTRFERIIVVVHSVRRRGGTGLSGPELTRLGRRASAIRAPVACASCRR